MSEPDQTSGAEGDPTVQRPHLRWTAAVLAVVALLSVVAFRVWSGSSEPAPPLDGSGRPVPAAPADPLEAGLEAAIRALEAGEVEAASLVLADLVQAHGESDRTAALARRIELRVRAQRAALRPIEFRVESFRTELESVFARVRSEGEVVHSTGPLVPSFARAGGPRRANVFTVRTSFDRGVTIELVEPGGLIGGPEVVFGPVELEALPHLTGGIVEFEDPDAPVTNLVVRYTASPYVPGLAPDGRAAPRVEGEAAEDLVGAAAAAIEDARIADAEALLARLGEVAPEHPDGGFLRQRLRDREEALRRNLRAARFVLVEVACDPSGDGTPWSEDGAEPAFEVRLEADGEQVAATRGGPTAPFLVLEDNLAPPPGNVLEVSARGDARLQLVVVDTSPTFSSTEVGAVELPVTLAELPRGSGTLTVEREPSVLVLPSSDANRVRRVVLRYSVRD
ncbi:MAG: hypothetical protein PVJ89_05760 [Planctomycetota bacterium]|jgi:hypothetical protein